LRPRNIKIRVKFRQIFHKKGNVMGSKSTEPQAALRKRGTNFLPSNLAFASINLLIRGPEESDTRFVKVMEGAQGYQHGREQVRGHRM
jgi:hypothetical protein